MADAGRALGRSYLAITDHSKGLKIAGGMEEDELHAQGRLLDALNTGFGDGFVLLKAVEANLDPAGALDLEAGALRGLDLVLAAFHSALRRAEDQTERYLAALRNPSVDVLAHPRCRVYDRRAGLSADWPRVFAEAARQGKAVEVDGFPDRQDLDLGLLEQARAAGCFVSLGSDAHRPDDLAALELASAAAVIVGVPARRILNTWSPDEVRRWARERRG
jgi:putative hydrolase